MRRAEYRSLVADFETFTARVARQRCVDDALREAERLGAERRYFEAAFAYETALMAAREIARKQGIDVPDSNDAKH